MGLQVVRKGSRGRRSFTARFLLTILLLAPLAACRPHDGGGCASPPLPAGHWPQDCWHPFSNSSVFYSALPDRSVLVAHSQPALAGPAQHPPGNLAVSQTGAGPGEPVFYAHATDPEFTLNCVNDDPGRPDHGCPIDTSKTGLKLRVPAGATPESNLSIVVGQPRKYDAHMIIIDENAKWEYDLWQVQSTSSWQQVQSNGLVVKGLDPAGGKIDFSWGGRIRLSDDGTAVNRTAGDPLDDANAAHWGETADRVRAEELKAGVIKHALWLNIPCVSADPAVFPADPVGKASPCSSKVTTELGLHPLGTRFWLDMTPAEIDALTVPNWKKVFLRALANYGGFVGDTNANSTWLFYIETEGGNMYSSLSDANGQPYPDLWWQLAQNNQWEPYQPPGGAPPELVGKLYQAAGDNTDWAHTIWPKLRVLNACLTPASGQACT